MAASCACQSAGTLLHSIAISRAGGFPVYGATRDTPEEIEQVVREVRAAIGNRPFGISSNLRHLCAIGAPATEYLRYDWRRAGLWNLVFAVGVLWLGAVAPAHGCPLLLAGCSAGPLGGSVETLAKLDKAFDELRFYSERFNTVEVNSTFYGQPRMAHDVEHHIHESPKSMTVPLMVLAALLAVLREAAQRGVRVRMIVDGTARRSGLTRVA